MPQNFANNVESVGRTRLVKNTRTTSLGFKTFIIYCVVFCIYGFLVSFKPSEPNLVPYLTTVKGLTDLEVEDHVFPFWTYSYFAFVFLVLILTEPLGYKIVIIIGSLARLATRVILIWGNGVLWMQIMQLTFGLASAIEVIYYSYVYYLVPEMYFQRFTSYTRAAVLLGHVTSSTLGQILVLQPTFPLINLFYISLATVAVGTIISFFFPGATNTDTEKMDVRSRIRSFFHEIKESYSSKRMQHWTVLYIFMFATHNLILNYGTVLFYNADPAKNYNGFIDAAARLFSSVVVLIPTKIEFTLKNWGLLYALIFAVLDFGVLTSMFFFRNLYFCYVGYFLHCGIAEFLLAIGSSEIAKSMKTIRFSTIFCINTALSLFIQTIIQVVIGHQVLGLNVFIKFLIFGVLWGIVAVFALLFLLRQKLKPKTYEKVKEEPFFNDFVTEYDNVIGD